MSLVRDAACDYSDVAGCTSRTRSRPPVNFFVFLRISCISRAPRPAQSAPRRQRAAHISCARGATRGGCGDGDAARLRDDDDAPAAPAATKRHAAARQRMRDGTRTERAPARCASGAAAAAHAPAASGIGSSGAPSASSCSAAAAAAALVREALTCEAPRWTFRWCGALTAASGSKHSANARSGRESSRSGGQRARTTTSIPRRERRREVRARRPTR